jgi:tetraacyldisaccharide 4'-kinase
MPFSWLYGAISNFRSVLYQKGALKSFSLGAPTISVGNITVGGTGKTPLVAEIVEILAATGEKPCIISRGYKRQNSKQRVLVSDWRKVLADTKTSGDEPFELARKLLGKAIVVADANRVEAAKWVCANFEITAFILDDAFQHIRAERDLNIIVIDATNPFGNGKTLPLGILREPLKNLKRADLIIITRTNLADEQAISSLKSQISNYADCPIITTENKISEIKKLEDFLINRKNSTVKFQKPTAYCFAFCALGNPQNFYQQLKRENFQITAQKTFPDHHFYTQSDIKNIETEARKSKAKILLTTAKDAVKLTDLKFEMPCFVIENKITFDNEKKLREMIRAVFEK